MRLHRNVVATFHSVFNWKLAAMAVIFNGLPVLYINMGHAAWQYLLAGGWQIVLSVLSTGTTGRLAQHYAEKYDEWWLAYPLGSVIPAALTFAFSVFGHWIARTPEILNSCLWLVAVSGVSTFLMNLANRHRDKFPDKLWARLFLKFIAPPQ